MVAIKYTLSLAVCATLTCNAACFAITGNDVVGAINAAHILDAGVGINARVDGDKVIISTYRNPKNNERDCKIDAVEIAKTVYDASKGSLARISICFFGKDMAQYQEVSISAGDLQAFASGQTGQDQLLSSLDVHTQKVANNADKVTNELATTTYGGGGYRVSQRGDDELLITTPMGPWVTDEECKLDALKIATIAANDLPDGVQKITIAFSDPSNRADTRLLTFAASGLIDAWKTVQHALSIFPVTKQPPAVDVQSMQASVGPCRPEREALLTRIKGLSSQGIGMASFVRYFQQIDDMARSGDETGVKSAVAHLSSSLDDQEKASKAAKEADSKHTVIDSSSMPKSGVEAKGVGGRWGILPKQPVLSDEVVADPQSYLRNHMHGLPPIKQKALFDIVLKLLQANGKQDVAATIMKQGLGAWTH